MECKADNENWETVLKFLPYRWEERAKDLGALTRQRKLKSPEELLRVLLIHLADGCSLRETVARARQGKISEISDVALLKRLRASSEWFRWMTVELVKKRGVEEKKPEWLSSYNVRSIDASIVSEPGSTGTDWRLHYSLLLFGLHCDHFILTRPEVGESLTNFPVSKGDLVIGDRAYGTLKGLWHVRNSGGEFLVRLKNKAFPIYSGESGTEFKLLKELKKIRLGEVKEWNIEGRGKEVSPMELRLCAVKKSKEAAEESIKRALREMNKQQNRIDPETLELHRYVVLAASPGTKKITAKQLARLYQTRWQIEIAFKRLKSIMGLGHLPKTDIESSRAWLHGKLFVSLLVQTMVDEGRFFSPWGYPLGES